jgi:glucose-6-phosphate 1-dehydrogenase
MWYDPSLEACDYLPDALTIFVVGASGDLAKKKTYPSLFDLYRHGFLTKRTTICGYARSAKSDVEFKDMIRPFLAKKKNVSGDQVEAFLNLCLYRNGAYDSVEDVANVFEELKKREQELFCGKANRLFYFAIPPSVFVPIGKSIKEGVIARADPKTTGWSRLIVEKPFGHDSESFQELSNAMGALYTEDYIYRIDHYLGKEMVQNLVILRFANVIFEPLWNHRHIKSVIISFKEDFGTKGRGGYFDGYGYVAPPILLFPSIDTIKLIFCPYEVSSAIFYRITFSKC